MTAAAAVAIISMGLMNAVRSSARRPLPALVHRRGHGVHRRICLPVLPVPGNPLHQPASRATAVLVVVELFFSVAG